MIQHRTAPDVTCPLPAAVLLLALVVLAPAAARAQLPANAPGAALTPAAKFAIFTQHTYDPLVWATAGLDAVVGQARNVPADFGQGGAGYGKRFGAALADQASADFFGRFLFPTILHQDPRYLRRGEGPFMRRLGHVVGGVLVTRTDSGRRTFNTSLVAGSLVAGSLANTYYPDQERGIGLTLSRAGFGLLGAAATNLRREFWPDVRRKFSRAHQPSPPATE